jgi:hypothetical protein
MKKGISADVNATFLKKNSKDPEFIASGTVTLDDLKADAKTLADLCKDKNTE